MRDLARRLGPLMLLRLRELPVLVASSADAAREIMRANNLALAIGLALLVAHLIGIPITNASLNPARSIASAIFSTTGAWSQIWLFIVGPLAGGALGGLIWRTLLSPGETPANIGQVK